MKETLDFIDFILKNPNAGTFVVALLTFSITFVNFYKDRAVITFTQLRKNSAVIIKPDRVSQEKPDLYWHHDYRVIMDAIITNKSAKPISIIEFTLNNSLHFNSYSEPGSAYPITIKPSRTIDSNYVIFSYGHSLKQEYRVHDAWLKPVIDIPPYTSVRGYLMFHFSSLNEVANGTNELKIVTSRKTFTKKIQLTNGQFTALPLPKELIEARKEKFE